jgi:hypothetical protein
LLKSKMFEAFTNCNRIENKKFTVLLLKCALVFFKTISINN